MGNYAVWIILPLAVYSVGGQKVVSRLGGTADQVSMEGMTERSAAREPGALSSPRSSCSEPPLPRPAPGSTPRPGRFVPGTTTDEVH